MQAVSSGVEIEVRLAMRVLMSRIVAIAGRNGN